MDKVRHYGQLGGIYHISITIGWILLEYDKLPLSRMLLQLDPSDVSKSLTFCGLALKLPFWTPLIFLPLGTHMIQGIG